MNYISAKEASEKWGITGRMVNHYCIAGRITGVQKVASMWIIPIEAPKPVDRRKK